MQVLRAAGGGEHVGPGCDHQHRCGDGAQQVGGRVGPHGARGEHHHGRVGGLQVEEVRVQVLCGGLGPGGLGETGTEVAHPGRADGHPHRREDLGEPAHDRGADGEQAVADGLAVEGLGRVLRGAGDQHQPERAIGGLAVGLERGLHAHRVAHHHGPVHPRVVEHGDEVAADAVHRDVVDGEVAGPAARVARQPGPTVAPGVGEQARVASSLQLGEELAPVGIAARPAVGEDHRHGGPVGVAEGVGDGGAVVGHHPPLLAVEGVAGVGGGVGFPRLVGVAHGAPLRRWCVGWIFAGAPSGAVARSIGASPGEVSGGGRQAARRAGQGPEAASVTTSACANGS